MVSVRDLLIYGSLFTALDYPSHEQSHMYFSLMNPSDNQRQSLVLVLIIGFEGVTMTVLPHSMSMVSQVLHTWVPTRSLNYVKGDFRLASGILKKGPLST